MCAESHPFLLGLPHCIGPARRHVVRTGFGADMYFVDDPLPYRNTNYDIEGLSDWRKTSLPVAKVGRLWSQREPFLASMF